MKQAILIFFYPQLKILCIDNNDLHNYHHNIAATHLLAKCPRISHSQIFETVFTSLDLWYFGLR